MALRKIESFGWLQGSQATWIPLRWNLYSAPVTLFETPGRRPGSYYLNLTPNINYYFGQLFDNQATWIIHTALNMANQTAIILQIADGATVQLILRFNAATQNLELYRGPLTTLIGTSSHTITPNVWHHLILAVTINNSGTAEVRVDGETVISFSGDTQQSANAYAGTVYFFAQRFHDIVICDGTGSAPYNGIMGDMAVYCVLPNGAGAVTGWTPSAGSNFQNVDDTTPDSDTTYNSTAAAGATDRYAIPSPTLTGSCRGVCVGAVVRKDDAGARVARLKLYDGTTLQSAANANLADSYTIIDNLWPTNPTSGTHWTASELAAAEPGIEMVS